jgi:ubiquinone biosynthesis protein COQ4
MLLGSPHHADEYQQNRKLYETHVPISNAERVILAAGSAVTALLDPYRGG